KVLFPKSDDLTNDSSVKFEGLLLDNGNILVANGWVHVLVIGHSNYNNLIITYADGIQMSKVYLQDMSVIKMERTDFDLSKCK
ncbi:MAG: hypothetical protein AAF840_11300, partial [Bacteroidota bacterium]